MSLGQSLNISLNSLRNNQYALSVVSHNIANVNTEGYTRKRVNFAESILNNDKISIAAKIKSLNGSTISGLTDYMDEFAMGDIINSNSDAQYYNTLSDAVGGLEDIADSLGDNGLNAILNDFFAASASLEQFPDDLTIRQQFVYAAENVCDKFNEISKRYDDYQNSMISTAQDDTETVNSILAQIASLNETYMKNGKDPSIMDANMGLIKELSSYTDVITKKNENGTINVYIGNLEVVQGQNQKYNLAVSTNTNAQDGDTITFSLESPDGSEVITNGVNDAIKKGKIGATIEFLNKTGNSYSNIKDMKNAINEAANAFATELNKIQTYDDGTIFAANITTLNGENILEKSTHKLFVSKDGNDFSASNIAINSEIKENVYLVAAARIDSSKYTGDEWKYAVGNSTNAAKITDLQNQKICDYGGVEDNCTLSDFIATVSAKVGLDGASIKNKANTYQDILDSAVTNYNNVSGVNIDEEIADLLKYQRAYEASARVFSIINDIYDTILGLV